MVVSAAASVNKTEECRSLDIEVGGRPVVVAGAGTSGSFKLSHGYVDPSFINTGGWPTGAGTVTSALNTPRTIKIDSSYSRC